VRIASLLILTLALAGCSKNAQNKDAVRQGVIDYLTSKTGLNVGSMTVDVKSVNFNGNKAEAVVSFKPKGGTDAQGMEMPYKLEQQGEKWVVTGRGDSGQNAHGAAPAGGTENPHGGGMPGGAMPGGAAPQMPSAADLPPSNPAMGGGNKK
jgi:hypothetical protein